MLNQTELRWVLKGRHTLDTMPMERVAAYLLEYSKLLGEGTHVHFERAESSSVVLVATVDRSAKSEVLARCGMATNDNAPESVRKPYEAISRMAEEDDGRAHIAMGNLKIVRFKVDGDPQPTPFRGAVSFIGDLMRGGRLADGSHNARIGVTEGHEKRVVKIRVSEQSASLIKECLYETVRVSGMADWTRLPSGIWVYDDVRNAELEPVVEASLAESLSAIRAKDYGWNADPIGLQDTLREDDAE